MSGLNPWLGAATARAEIVPPHRTRRISEAQADSGYPGAGQWARRLQAGESSLSAGAGAAMRHVGMLLRTYIQRSCMEPPGRLTLLRLCGPAPQPGLRPNTNTPSGRVLGSATSKTRRPESSRKYGAWKLDTGAHPGVWDMSCIYLGSYFGGRLINSLPPCGHLARRQLAVDYSSRHADLIIDTWPEERPLLGSHV